MNKGIKVTLFCCAILLVIGAVLTFVGIAMGAKMHYTERDLEDVIERNFERTAVYQFFDRLD